MLEKEPDDVFLNYALAMEYKAKGETTAAILQLETLLLLDENYLGIYYSLGQLYEQEGEIKKAADIYKKGTEKAKQQHNNKTRNELNEALWLLEDEE